LQNVFCSVFELPSLRNTRKRDKTKIIEEKMTSKPLSIFLGKAFDMEFLQKHFYGVFELPLPRNARKRTPKKTKKKSRLVGGWVWDLANARGGPSVLFLAAPRPLQRTQRSWRLPEEFGCFVGIAGLRGQCNAGAAG
jgi:hypothetical protein